jgi:lipid II:glycine glycyltransferase (peptidoglycan interpeptide bridge formation enzyme)
MSNIITCDNEQQWDDFITSHPEANFLHSWSWGEFHTSRGKQTVRRILLSGDQVTAAYTGQVETARRGKYLAIAGGPIIDWRDKPLVKKLFDDIREQGVKLGCVFIRIRPQLELSDDSLKLFEELGLKKAPIYLSVEHAGILNLEKSEEEIMSNTSQRLRRAIRKAEKSNVSIETSNNPEDIREFHKIQLETAKRHDFVSFSESFLTKQFATFASKNQALLYTAKLDGQILAQNFMIFYGNEASYHYGVSTELGTQLSSAPLLHFAAIQEARERGVKRYNLWGIVDEDNIKHRFYGVSQFKRGFGVTDLRYTPAHDLILKSTHYQLTKGLETIRRIHRHV